MIRTTKVEGANSLGVIFPEHKLAHDQRAALQPTMLNIELSPRA